MKGRTKLLIVDSEEITRKANAAIADSEGFRVFEAGNGIRCLEITREERPEFILMETMLPDVNGVELCRQIKGMQDVRGSFVVLFSGAQINSTDTEFGLNSGADGYLTRPIPEPEFRSWLRTYKRMITAEKLVRDSEAKYRALVNRYVDILIVHNPEGNTILEVNETAERTYGYTREELLSLNISDINPKYSEIIKDGTFWKDLDLNKSFTSEAYHKRKDGSVFPVDEVITKINLNGTPVILGLYRDKTEKKKAEQEQELIVRELKLVNQTMLQANQLRDIDGLCTLLCESALSFNPGTCILITYPDVHTGRIRIRSFAAIDVLNGEADRLAEMLVDCMGTEANPHLARYTSGRLEYIEEGLYPLVEGILSRETSDEIGKVLGIESVYCIGFPPDPGLKGGLIMLLPGELKPQRTAMLETLVHHFALLIEQVQTEELLRKRQSELTRAQRIGHLGNYEWDVMNRTFSWSDEVYRIFGMDRDTFRFSYAGIEAMIHPDDRTVNADMVKRMLESPEPFNYELRILRPDGHVRNIFQSVEVSQDSEGKTQKVFGTIQDVTDFKRIERELWEKEEQLRALARHLQNAREEQSAYIAREMHDDLGQSLTSMEMMLTFLEQDLKEEKLNKKELFDTVKDMRNVLNSTVIKVRQLSAELKPGVLDSEGLQEALTWHIRGLEKHSSVTFHFNYEADDMDLTSEERIAVFRIITESLTNVLRHAGATDVHVSVRRYTESYAVIIHDNGKGFCPGAIKSTSSFGIISMKERATAFGWDLKVESSEGNGTRIELFIPGRETG